MDGTNLDVRIGTGLSLSFTCKAANGDPADLTDYSAYAVVKSSPADDTPVLDLDPQIETPASGVITINVDTSTVPAGVYGWDIVVKKTGEKPIFITGGNIKFRHLNTDIPS